MIKTGKDRADLTGSRHACGSPSKISNSLLREIRWRSGLGFICSGTIGFSHLASTPIAHLGCDTLLLICLSFQIQDLLPPAQCYTIPPSLTAPTWAHHRSVTQTLAVTPHYSSEFSIALCSPHGYYTLIAWASELNLAFLIFYCLFIRWTLCELSSSHSPVVPSVKLILTKKTWALFSGQRGDISN